MRSGRRWCGPRARSAALLFWWAASVASAEPSSDPAGPSLEERFADRVEKLTTTPFGRFYAQLRPRYEFADIERDRDSHALTLRGVVGFGSRVWKGLSFLLEGEGIATADDDWYFDGTGTPSGRSLIADPADIDLNQGYLHYELPEWTTDARAGRQRIILDDARFVGNVGWRQNEQTFDAAKLSTGFGRRDLRLSYAYVVEVLRIFGDQSPARARDFDSSSHLVNLKWSRLDEVELTAFAYLLDFDNAPEDSSNTWGLRLEGEIELDALWMASYAFSYAYQTDAANNSDHYRAHYTWAEGALGHEQAGTLHLIVERLGSDDGDAVFRTPIATVHNFNGWADAFLDNGGDDGLIDFFARIRPRLPWRLEGELALHGYWEDQGGDAIGWEIDAYLSRPVSRFATVLAKVAYFDRDGSDRERPDIFRAWLQVTIEL